MTVTNTPAPYVLVPRDVAAELIRRLDTMQVPHVLVQQITILGYMANMLREALAAEAALAAERERAEANERALWGVVANARSRVHRGGVLWAVVRDLTAQGSTSAAELCRRMGFDPDSTKRETDTVKQEARSDG